MPTELNNGALRAIIDDIDKLPDKISIRIDVFKDELKTDPTKFVKYSILRPDGTAVQTKDEFCFSTFAMHCVFSNVTVPVVNALAKQAEIYHAKDMGVIPRK